MRAVSLLAGWALVLMDAGAPVLADFVPGRIYISDPAPENCLGTPPNDRERIWEVDPFTGNARIFAEILMPHCGALYGLAFSPDGARLRASIFLRSEILEFDGDGNLSVALNTSDGIAGPFGSNNLAYNRNDDFYVVNGTPNIMRFPADGGPGTVFAGSAQGVTAGGAISAAPNGDLYYLQPGFHGRVVRFSPDGQPYFFPDTHRTYDYGSLTVDAAGDVFLYATDGIHRYLNGDPATRELIAPLPGSPSPVAITYSSLDGLLYLTHAGRLYSLDREGAELQLIAERVSTSRSFSTGVAVYVPEPTASLVMPVIVLLVGRWLCR